MARALFALVLLGVLWIGSQVVATSRRSAVRAARLQADAARDRDDSAATAAAYASLTRASRAVRSAGVPIPDWVQRLQARRLKGVNPAPARDAAGEATLLGRHVGATYLDAVAAQNRWELVRWPARTEPLRAWVQGQPGLAHWTAEHRSVARGALLTWDAAGLPFRIVATDDSTQADLFVLWAQRIDRAGESARTMRIGETNRVTDEHGWILAATITLALDDASGEPLDVYTVQNMVRHELGHAIGLDHSPDTSDVMAAIAGRQARLSDRDVSTARLLYALQPGEYPGPHRYSPPRRRGSALR